MPNHLISPWTPEQDELLRQHYNTSPRSVLDQVFSHRTRVALTKRAMRIGLPSRDKHIDKPAKVRLSREEYMQKRQDSRKETYKKSRLKDKRVHMVTDARRRAKEKGIECTITKHDFVIPEYCPVFGVKLEHGQGYPTLYSPSLDRKDITKGYTPDNIWIISYKANRSKNDSTLAELKMIVAALEKALTPIQHA